MLLPRTRRLPFALSAFMNQVQENKDTNSLSSLQEILNGSEKALIRGPETHELLLTTSRSASNVLLLKEQFKTRPILSTVADKS